MPPRPLSWTPDLTHALGPRYLALADAIDDGIRSGRLPPETKLPTHRALADALRLTVGTITRGYAEAERRGAVYGVVGRGTFIKSPRDALNTLRVDPVEDGVIDLGLNIPAPVARAGDLSAVLGELTCRPDTLESLLLYQPDTGVSSHRQTLAQWVARDDWRPDPANVVVTMGGQHGILVALMAVTRPGDLVLSEGLTYPGLSAVCNQLGVEALGLDMDEHGLIPAALEAACQQRRPRALYCIPSLQNPTATIMPLARRQHIVALCERYEVTIIEDDVNGPLCEPLPVPLAALAPHQVIYLGSLSKVVAPGLRVGLLVAPEPWISKLGTAVRASCWMTSPLQTEIACEWIRQGRAARQCEAQRQEMAARIALARRVLSGLDFRVNDHGFHVWLTLPEPWRAGEFEREARARGVLIKGAGIFAIGRYPTPHAVRIALSSARSRNELEKGLGLLKEMIANGPEHHLELV